MSKTGLIKFGYLVIGAGIGFFASSYILAYEFRKPVGEIEEFISKDENDISDDSSDFSETEGSISGLDKRGSRKIFSENDTVDGNGYGAESRGDRREEIHKEFSANQTEILNYYKSNKRYSERPENAKTKKRSKRRKEFDKMREEGNANLTTRYSKMYNSVNTKLDEDDREMTDILHEVSSHTDSQDSYSKYADISDDCPSDDDYDQYPETEMDIHDQYNLERVEESIEIYLDDNPQDFATLIFYEGDSTLCDDGEQIIPNKEDVVGEVALTRLTEGGPGADNGIIFVHNLKTGIDYEVVLDAGSYSQTVIGQFEDHLHNSSSRPIKGANGDGDH